MFIQPDKTISNIKLGNVEGYEVAGALEEKINRLYPNFRMIINDGQLIDVVEVAPPVIQKSAEEQINELKIELSETDYKVIKCYEYQLAGLELPYDIEVLHAERQAIRDKINELEG